MGRVGHGEDNAVVAAAQAGDERAFTALVERYRPELQVHWYRMLGSVEEAEDMTQETFLRAWRHRETCQGRSTFRAWLYRIATNVCFSRFGPQTVRPTERATRDGAEVLTPQVVGDHLVS